MDTFTVYVLFSDIHNELYVGYTSNIEARLQSHNSIKNKGYTKRYQPWQLVYTEFFDNKQSAMIREKQLKSAKGRLFIRQNILKQT